MLNQVSDEVIDNPHLQTNDPGILIPFTVGGDVHCFIEPIKNLKRANRKLPVFPSTQGEDLLINQDLDISFFISQNPFRNNPKINARGTDFTAWYERLAPTKRATWGALGIQDLLRLSHFSLLMLPWMIGVVTFFWNRTTNNFHLPCGMTGMSLLDVAAITGLPISPPAFTSDMQPRQQYNIAPTNSYSDFIVHHMGAEGTTVTDDEHVVFLFYWLNAVLFCSRSVQMSKLFLPFATLLHEGNNLNLDKLLLGHIFEELCQYSRTLEEIKHPAVQTAPAAEGSPRRTQKRKAETIASSRQSLRKSRQTPSKTSRKINHNTTTTTRSRTNHISLINLSHRVCSTSPSRFSSYDWDTGSGNLGVSIEPISATLANLVSILNQAIQEDEVPISVLILLGPSTSGPPSELNVNAREQLLSLLKLLDHPPIDWINDAVLNKLLSDLLNSTFELLAPTPHSAIVHQFKQIANKSVATQEKLQEIKEEEAKIRTEAESYIAALQPIKACREEFDLRISQAISIQAHYDKEENKLEAELAQINDKLARIWKRRADIATPLATAQQEQHQLIQEIISNEAKQEECEKQLNKAQYEKFRHAEALSVLDNERVKLRSDLANPIAPHISSPLISVFVMVFLSFERMHFDFNLANNNIALSTFC
ncbi:hypothetical protein Ahy_A01g002544 [Arachis hypogaea]|uniref:Aminotransferase-like plant mobile domain-containing protein n=1 Tax=Arachis hypogaea TaxID=3818 RepID=A0A445EQV4_ARAHY|nr:hypothetical protein Ahy_A01g002544 [Arachis hypogaea]